MPADIRRTPAPGSRTPTGIRRTPAPGRWTPAGIRRTPAPGSRTPASLRRMPAPGSRTPTGIRRTPAPGSRTPADIRRTPAPGSRTPAILRRMPAPGRRTPADMRCTAAPLLRACAPVQRASPSAALMAAPPSDPTVADRPAMTTVNGDSPQRSGRQKANASCSPFCANHSTALPFAGLIRNGATCRSDSIGMAAAPPNRSSRISGSGRESTPQNAAISCAGDRIPPGVSSQGCVSSQETARRHHAVASSNPASIPRSALAEPSSRCARVSMIA